MKVCTTLFALLSAVVGIASYMVRLSNDEHNWLSALISR